MTITPSSASDLRKSELAKIHIAKADLRLTQGDYESLLWTVCRVRTAADLDWTGRKKLLDHFQKLGWKPKRHRKLAQGATARKIRSLWLQLRDIGVLENPDEAALLAYVKRMTDVDRLEWLNDAQERRVIESLKQWLTRAKREKSDRELT